MKYINKKRGKNNYYYLLWYKKIGKEILFEVESLGAQLRDVSGCWGKGMILIVEMDKYKICGLIYFYMFRNKGIVIKELMRWKDL